jgi:hypothetical protein
MSLGMAIAVENSYTFVFTDMARDDLPFFSLVMRGMVHHLIA